MKNKRGGKKDLTENFKELSLDLPKSKGETGTRFDQLDKAFFNYLSEVGLSISVSMLFVEKIVSTFSEAVNDKFFMVQIIKKVITYSVFEEIQKLSSLTNQDWATILNVSTRSLQRYKEENQLFKPIHSEKIIEIGEIFLIGIEVFGNSQKFNLWLETPNFALGNLKPLELLSDSYGQQLIINEITRINYGILA